MVRFLLHGYGTFDRDRSITPTIWPHFDLFTVHSGMVHLRIMEQNDVELRSGDGVLIFPRTLFAGQSVSKSASVSIQYFQLNLPAQEECGPIFGQFAGSQRGFRVVRSTRNPHLARDAVRAMDLAKSPDSSVLQASRTALLQLMLATCLERPSATLPEEADLEKGALDGLQDWAFANLSELSIKACASYLNCSVSHCHALFRRHYGITPGSYIRHLRLAEAKRSLSETRKSLREIARYLGYSDAISFHRFFFSSVGVTPAAYRKLFSRD